MKRLISVILFLTLILSVIYIPATAADLILPDGTELSEGYGGSYDGYTAISTAEEFKNIAAGGKYYLTANIDLTEDGISFNTLAGGLNSADVLIIDGCGYTVTTNKPLFGELPGGGAVGEHSEIRNLIIKGDITVAYDEITTYNTGASVGALAGKANGGIFENIVNNANITISGIENLNVRVGGLVGSVFNDDVTFNNCVNNGDIFGYVGASNTTYGMGGIIGYVANGSNSTAYEAIFDYCENTGNLTNQSTVVASAFTGGIFGNKRSQPTATVTNCQNSGEISAIGQNGADVYQAMYASSSFSGVSFDYIAVSTAEEFSQIASGKKYYLTNNIDLTASGVSFTTLIGGNKDAAILVIDGCGYTVTTNKPLIEELPGGGVGKHSEIRNLTLEGTIRVTNNTITGYNNGMSVGALVGKSNGGIYKNITNNASVTLSNESGARVGGIIGAAFNESIYFENCINNGAVDGKSSVADDTKYGVGGIIAYIGLTDANEATFIECANNGNVSNTSSAIQSVYAGGIIAVKQKSESVVNMLDCVNTGKISAKTAYGNYCAISTYQSMNVVKPVPVSTAEEFMQIKGKGAYKLTDNITITSPNTNEFTGYIYGNGYTVTSPGALFKNDEKVKLCDLKPNVDCLNIKSRPLESFAVIAPTTSNGPANAIVDFIKAKYNITLALKASSENYSGNAIYINCGNTYGDVRHGLDYETTDDGYFHIYLDETDANISAYVTSFLIHKLKTNKTAYDFFDNFGQKDFYYTMPEGTTQGYRFKESEDVVRKLGKGVTYINRTYHTNTVDVSAYIIVLESDANAHIEVNATELTTVTECKNSNQDNCWYQHGTGLTPTDHAAEMESEGKDVIMAMNAGFFMLSAECYAPWGLQISNGVVSREPSDKTDSLKKYSNWFGITKDGAPVISDMATYYSTYQGNLSQGVCARYIGIKDGKYKQYTSTAYDARTAIGYNSDGDVVMVVVPGDDTDANELGATLSNMAQIFMDLDMDITDMLNLDGGGSSAMLVDDAKGAVKLETPLLSTTEERALGNVLAIVAG